MFAFLQLIMKSLIHSICEKCRETSLNKRKVVL